MALESKLRQFSKLFTRRFFGGRVFLLRTLSIEITGPDSLLIPLKGGCGFSS